MTQFLIFTKYGFSDVPYRLGVKYPAPIFESVWLEHQAQTDAGLPGISGRKSPEEVGEVAKSRQLTDPYS